MRISHLHLCLLSTIVHYLYDVIASHSCLRNATSLQLWLAILSADLTEGEYKSHSSKHYQVSNTQELTRKSTSPLVLRDLLFIPTIYKYGESSGTALSRHSLFVALHLELFHSAVALSIQSNLILLSRNYFHYSGGSRVVNYLRQVTTGILCLEGKEVPTDNFDTRPTRYQNTHSVNEQKY